MIKGGTTISERFQFGENWSLFLELLDDERIREAENSLKNMFNVSDLSGKRFLDIGSGSGLFSLAARNLGAEVYSFDYDPKSVACAEELRRRYYDGDTLWAVERGDALDANYIASLGLFDIVYSWGVLHHTGDMWKGLDYAASLVKPNGLTFIALYNDQRWLSRYWLNIKKIYNKNPVGKFLVIATHAPYFLVRQYVKNLIVGGKRRRRGMDPWRDIIDWVGGYPFEVARPEQVLGFYRQRSFILEKMTTVDGRHGCNEFVLRKAESA